MELEYEMDGLGNVFPEVSNIIYVVDYMALGPSRIPWHTMEFANFQSS